MLKIGMQGYIVAFTKWHASLVIA